MFNVNLEIQKCVSVLFTGTTCARQVHRGHVNVLSGIGPKHFQSYWGKFWRRSMSGLWPGAKERNLFDDSVAYEESCAPHGHTVLQVCRWAHVLYAEHIEFSQVACQFSLLDTHDADAVGLH